MADPYATPADLQTFVSAATWAEITEPDRQLRRASEEIDDVVRLAYEIDVDGLPTDTDVAEVLREATCAQVEAWVEVGEENDIDGLAGSHITVTGYSGQRAPRLAPRALRILRVAGLTSSRETGDRAAQFFATQSGN
jgi:hypothetical protein